MADIAGVLGEASSVAVGTYTAYTVPSGKNARVKIMYNGVAGASSTLAVIINGITIFTTAALTSTQIQYTSNAQMHNAVAAAGLTGATEALTCAPGPREYFLSAGDIVQYTIGTAAFSSMSFQVVGVEIDNA